MSKRKGQKSRLKLFDLGNTRCPICMTQFTRDAAAAGVDVTLEHVPPKSVGGSVMCLTCTDCNQSASRSLDQATAMSSKAIKNRLSGRGVKMEVDVYGTKHTTYFSPDGIGENNLDTRLARNPIVKQFLNDKSDQKVLLLAEMTRGPVWDASKGMTLSIKQPPPNYIEVSWLRSAYLLVFSLLGPAGYRYAESESICPIREQIRNPGKELVPSLLYDVSQMKVPRDLVMVNDWQQPFCWVVKLGDMGVLLPHGGGAEHYKAVLAMPDQITPKGVIGWTPKKFGTNFSFEFSLREDSCHVGRDLFAEEMTISEGDLECKYMVVNQQDLLSTLFPSSPAAQRATSCKARPYPLQ